MKILNESLNYLDLKDQLKPILGIDEFKSRVGNDEDLITLNFTIKSKDAAEDLVNWLERGYDFILDSEASPGQVENGNYYVFAELRRRPSSPRKIMEILSDLETLTEVKAENWTVKIDHKRYDASKEIITELIPLTSNDYAARNEEELNEWREIAGLNTVSTYEQDEDILAIQRQAGLK